MKRIVILTGAGVSAESGVPTFRDAGGLWEGRRVEDVATPAAFQRNPELVHRFYNLRRKAMQNCEPNPAHRAIARLQKAWAEHVRLITQNVDDLHERGGQRRLRSPAWRAAVNTTLFSLGRMGNCPSLVTDVANAVERYDPGDRFGNERKPLSPTRVEDHRLIIDDEVLAEIEATGDSVDPQRSIDTVNSGCNFVDSCSGMSVCLHDLFPPANE